MGKVFSWLTGKSRRTADSSVVGQQQRLPLTSQPAAAGAEVAAGGLYPSQANSVQQIEGDAEADLNL